MEQITAVDFLVKELLESSNFFTIEEKDAFTKLVAKAKIIEERQTSIDYQEGYRQGYDDGKYDAESMPQ